MDLYQRKKRWKLFLFGAAVAIIGISLYYTNILVDEIRKDERRNVEVWAEAIHQKAEMVNFTNKLFERMKEEERKRASIVAEAQKQVLLAPINSDLNFYTNIIQNNTTIPVIITDRFGNITNARNVDFSLDTVKRLEGTLLKEFSVYPPIVSNYFPPDPEMVLYLYYKDSNIFTELRNVLNDLIRSFFSEVALNSASVPVIITDSTKRNIIQSGNIPENKMKDSAFVNSMLKSMSAQNKPIQVNIAGTGIRYIFYRDSFLLMQLRYYPYVQFIVIGLFLFIAYLLFSYARKSEQNQVWVGMAKETAHQLGTPLSSMVAWIELLKIKGVDSETLSEIEKDVSRLETITDRFSKIGSAAHLEVTNLVGLVHETISYIRARTSQKVTFTVIPDPSHVFLVPLNVHLFEWVIENLCKNAVDAMEGTGKVTIEISETDSQVILDVCDTGKGIPKSKFKTIFHPGFTSKQRGWGLGLTLSRRIVQNYHSGKIFVKSSSPGKGTTFRIILNK